MASYLKCGYNTAAKVLTCHTLNQVEEITNMPADGNKLKNQVMQISHKAIDEIIEFDMVLGRLNSRSDNDTSHELIDINHSPIVGDHLLSIEDLRELYRLYIRKSDQIMGAEAITDEVDELFQRRDIVKSEQIRRDFQQRLEQNIIRIFVTLPLTISLFHLVKRDINIHQCEEQLREIRSDFVFLKNRYSHNINFSR